MSDPMQMWNAWCSLSLQPARLAWEAQSVVALRCMQIATESAQFRQKPIAMVTEKIAALTEAQVAAATAAVEGSSSRQVTRKVWAFQKARSSQQTKIHEIERLGKSHVRGQGRARVRNNEMLNIISRTGVVITIISLGLALSACGYNTIPTLEEQATQDACQVASRKKVLGEPLNSSLSSERVRESGPVVV
jgi:hypothetical protein